MFIPKNDLSLGIDLLKLKAMILSQNMQLPDEVKQKIMQLISSSDLSTTEFINQFNSLVVDYQPKGWRIIALWNQFKDEVLDRISFVTWIKIGLAGVLVLFILFIIKKYKLQKLVKKLYAIILNILERLAALCGYMVPLITVYTAYTPLLLSRYPYIHFIMPIFIHDGMDFYIKHPWVINYGYFFTTLYGVTLFRLPKPRFVRFHLIRSLMLLAFQGIPDSVFKTFQPPHTATPDQAVTTALCLFSINLSWILPCIYQAITYTYPRSSFIREAIEVNVGRDKDEGFKWWDRR
jgi:uncharacterized membrane protein